ncbi:MAG: hypothetical protein NT085_00870 [candidate division SR1 bacterium]|nr:hypothetical protein [candidate division SR1 bacterium]
MEKRKKIFVICPVEITDDVTKKKLEDYKKKLEAQGYEVYLPHFDTNQEASEYEICLQKMKAIMEADEVHIFFVPLSCSSHFDLGITFLACSCDEKKIIKVIENGGLTDEHGQIKLSFEKSFGQMIQEWEKNISHN